MEEKAIRHYSQIVAITDKINLKCCIRNGGNRSENEAKDKSEIDKAKI